MPFELTEALWVCEGRKCPATLPGRLLPALCEAGLAPPPDAGFASLQAEWTLLREWSLESVCDLSRFQAERAFLVGRGVRGHGTLLIAAGKEETVVGPFPADDFEMEITPCTAGRDTVRVILRFDKNQPRGTPPEARLGVDGALFVREVSQLHIDEWRLTPRLIDGCGVLEARPTVSPYVPGRYIFRYTASLAGETLVCEEFAEKLYAAPASPLHRLVLPVPRLHAVGEENPPITVRLTVLRGGAVCDDRLLTTGFLPASFAEAPPLQLQYRGAPLFLTGAEWGDTAFCPLSPEEITRRLALLARAHIRCIRADGPQPDAFYDALDTSGFLLWQVLPLDPEAARMIIRSVRHRPSLIAYGCQRVFQRFNRPAGLDHPVVAALLRETERLDGAHPFFGPIPGGPVAIPGREELGTGVSRDVRGPVGLENPETFCRDMNADDAMIRTLACPAPAPGAPLGDAALYLHHGAALPEAAALGEWFDTRPEDPIAVPLLRHVQAETLRYAVERARARGAAGVFVEDPFAGANAPGSTALTDGDAPRPAYYALESALRPVHGCARLDRAAYYCGTPFEAKVCLLRDAPTPGALTVRAALYLPDGAALAEADYPVPTGGEAAALAGGAEALELGLFRADLPDTPAALTFRVRVTCLDRVIDENDYTICTALHALCWPLAHAPYAAVRREGEALTNDCAQTALGVYGGAYADAAHPGWGSLLPGETRALSPNLAETCVRGLNVEPRE